MRVKVNGELKECADSLSVLNALKLFNMPLATIIVEYNGKILLRAEWVSITLKDNDSLEVVHFIGGG